MKFLKKILCLLLTFALSLSFFSACDKNDDKDPETPPTEQGGGEGGGEEGNGEEGNGEVTIDGIRFTYKLTAADEEEFDALLATCETVTLAGTDEEAIEAAWEALIDKFDYISTQSGLAYLMHCTNTKDTKLSDNYQFASKMRGDIYLKYVKLCVKIYESESPYREEFFSDWSEADIQSILQYTEEINELREDNDQILVDYRALDDAAIRSGASDLYRRLVKNNNTIAQKFDYDNYYDYAFDNVYVRDYGEEELEDMRNYVAQYLVPLAQGAYDRIIALYNSGSSVVVKMDQFNTSYYKRCMVNGKTYLDHYIDSLGGSMTEGMRHMFENNNSIFMFDNKALQGAFQTSFDYYDTSFCFFGYGYNSSLTVIHEIGHYYASLHEGEGSLMYDLAETQSQGNEWLMLAYMNNLIEDEELYQAIIDYQLYSTLATIIVSTIVNEFESVVYSTEGIENYTSAQFDNIMSSVCTRYGGISKINSLFTDIQNYWRLVVLESPVYYISYATSAIASLNLYSLACSDYDAAKEAYRNLVEEVDYEAGFQGNLENIGLGSPFDEQSYIALAALMSPDFE